MPKYPVNDGNRDFAIRVGCEKGFYDFVTDYAASLGVSRSAGLRRLGLLGARCESEHGNATMPASYGELFREDKPDNGIPEDEFDWGED